MCALVTGVQTCALPICRRAQRRRFRSAAPPLPVAPPRRRGDAQRLCAAHDQGVRGLSAARSRLTLLLPLLRSAERRVVNECVSTCRSRWLPAKSKKQQTDTTTTSLGYFKSNRLV